MAIYDAIVIGVGGMGSAALYQMARRGMKVIGLDRYDIPNDMGSSHGISRIIRLTYHEHPSYVPLLRRSYELWRQLENTADERLLISTGIVNAGKESSGVFQGSKESCEIHNVPYEVMSGPEVNERFPGYQLPEDSVAVYQADGGFLLSERCIVANVNAALELGAEVHGREPAIFWRPTRLGVRVETHRSDYDARRLVIAAGAWSGEMESILKPIAIPERQVLGWFQPSRPELYRPDRFPVFSAEFEEGRYYGYPSYGIPGFKIGKYNHLRQQVSPDLMDRDAHPEDEMVLRGFTRRYMPLAAGPTLALKTCIFTNTPDEHFILDLHPGYPQVSIAAGFSGHGFKFCSVVGEIMADLAQEGNTRHDLSLFRLNRFDGISAG